MRPTAKSLILDLLATLRRGSMPVRALVAAGRLFAVSENSMRVALARLLAAGLVERDDRGCYRPGRGASAVGQEIARWRRREDDVRAWDGGWVGVVGPADGRALRFLAFRELGRGLAIRPDNLTGGVQGVRERLRALGLAADAVVAGIRDLDPLADARARRLWDTAALRAEYRAARASLTASEQRLARLSRDEAMVESFLLGGRIIRQIVLDPLLPEPLVSGAERSALVEAMRRYDEVGRACWAGFMRGFGVLPERRAPADVRIAEAVA